MVVLLATTTFIVPITTFIVLKGGLYYDFYSRLTTDLQISRNCIKFALK